MCIWCVSFDMSSGYTYQFHNAFFFPFQKDKFNKSSLAVMRLGQGYIVVWYLSRSLVTWLLLQYLANNCQQGARRGIQGQTYIPGVFLFMAAAAFRTLWSVCLQQIQITFCTCIGQHENITSHFALFTITPHKLLMSEFRPCYFYMWNTAII